MNRLDRHWEELYTCWNCNGWDKHETLPEVKCQTPWNCSWLTMWIHETCDKHSQLVEDLLAKRKTPLVSL